MAPQLPAVQTHLYFPAVTIDARTWRVFDRHMDERLQELERRFYQERANPPMLERGSWQGKAR